MQKEADECIAELMVNCTVDIYWAFDACTTLIP
jgi:hypothetical protein